MVRSTPRASVPHSQFSTPSSQSRRSAKRVRLQIPSNTERPKKRRTHPESSPTKRPQALPTSDIARDEAHQQPQRVVDELEEDDSLNEVMMAIDMRDRDTIGCSYYAAREEKLYVLSDIKYGGLDIIDTRKFS